MKKIVSTLLIMFLTIMTLNINSYAAGLSASNNASSSTKVGDTVTITVSCGSVYGLEFNMSLTGLSFVSGSVSGGFVSGGNSRISAMSSGTSPFSSVTLRFTVTGQNASCSISGGKTFDTDGGTVSTGLSTSTSFRAKTQAEIDSEKAAQEAAAKAAEEAARAAAASQSTTTKSNTNKKNTTKNEQVAETATEEPENTEENEVKEEAANEIKEEVVETPKEEKQEKKKFNFDDLDPMKVFMFSYGVILSIIAVAEAVVITKRKDGKRSK